jgi:DNA-binding transcriptional LysR family regulator
MDAGTLKVFEAVARLGGMNRAAAELNTAQSNVTGRIRQLEAELGVPLFRRHPRGVALTTAGQTPLPYAMRIGRLLEEAAHAVRNDGAPKGALTIGWLETTAAERLSPVLATCAGAYPEVDLVLRTGTAGELIESVLEHRLQGAFVCGPVDHPELEADFAFREELVLVAPRSVRRLEELVRRRNLKIVVLRAGCSYRQRLVAVLAARGIVGLRRLEFGTIDGILGCVARRVRRHAVAAKHRRNGTVPGPGGRPRGSRDASAGRHSVHPSPRQLFLTGPDGTAGARAPRSDAQRRCRMRYLSSRSELSLQIVLHGRALS